MNSEAGQITSPKMGGITDSTKRYGFWQKSLTNRSGVFSKCKILTCKIWNLGTRFFAKNKKKTREKSNYGRHPVVS
jgi:hypothetical protein